MSEFIETEAPTVLVLAEVLAERANQDAKWGEQNHPSLPNEAARRRCAQRAESWKRANDTRANEGRLTWDGILLEEVYEALAEGDIPGEDSFEDKLRAELVQTAAVAVAWIESIDRRNDETELGVDADGDE